MVVDTSALVALLLEEPEAEAFARAIEGASLPLISAVSRVELSMVIETRKGEDGRAIVERLLREGGFEVAAVNARQADLAIEAFRRFGKGRHKAGLNFGDCFAYALAKDMDEPLLFKGNHFRHTDVEVAEI